ncbi:MAG: hypothetical protein V3T05_04800 [Myxococcota bacterium]
MKVVPRQLPWAPGPLRRTGQRLLDAVQRGTSGRDARALPPRHVRAGKKMPPIQYMFDVKHANPPH